MKTEKTTKKVYRQPLMMMMELEVKEMILAGSNSDFINVSNASQNGPMKSRDHEAQWGNLWE